MKFKRTIASILAATFSLTLIGQSASKTFAKGETPEITTEEKLDSNPPEETIQEETKEELKEKIKKLKNEITDLKKENGWSFKRGVRLVALAILTTSSYILLDASQDPELLTGHKNFGKVLLNNIVSKKYKYLFNGLVNASQFITWHNLIFA
ncbi:MAG: hypothetical protein IJI84_03745 [Clostridia bacterium]|nr:hypothetical protein [Clostridia bacterium]